MGLRNTSSNKITGKLFGPCRIDRSIHSSKQPTGFDKFRAHEGFGGFLGQGRTREDYELLATGTQVLTLHSLLFLQLAVFENLFFIFLLQPDLTEQPGQQCLVDSFGVDPSIAEI